MKSLKGLIVCLSIFMITVPTTSYSGGSKGPGIIAHKATKIGFAQYFEKRNRIALDYAFDENSEFSKMVNDYILGEIISLTGAPSSTQAREIADVMFSIKEQISLVEYSGTNGLDIVFWSKAFTSIAEPLLGKYMDSQVPGSSKLISPVKIGVAFATAYSYGFMKGV